MSRDIKYIGMDVHKEAIVIAVLNGSGATSRSRRTWLKIWSDPVGVRLMLARRSTLDMPSVRERGSVSKSALDG
jgi:hypothetical protein